MATVHAGERTVGGTLICIGLASLGVLLLAVYKVTSLERAFDIGDLPVLGVFAAFGSFCALLGWRLFRRPDDVAKRAGPTGVSQEHAPPTRVRLSQACAALGVVLLVLSVLVPSHWHPVVLLFLGLALLAISHGLTPCVERIEQLQKARALDRQL